MERVLKKFGIKKFLILTLVSIALVLAIANLIGKDIASIVSLTLYFPVTISLVTVSVVLSKRFGLKGSHGRAWLLFTVFAILWFIAERISFYYNLTLGEELFPSEADGFWLAGYPFLFVFTMYYLKPMKEMIDKKIILVALATSVTVLISTLYLTYGQNEGADHFAFVIAIAYPIADSIILAPAIVGMMLFFGGKVNFLWSLMCIAIVIETIADAGYLVASLNGSYYQGHIVDTLYLWYYVIFTFAVYHHIIIFKDHRKDPYKNVEELK